MLNKLHKSWLVQKQIFKQHKTMLEHWKQKLNNLKELVKQFKQKLIRWKLKFNNWNKDYKAIQTFALLTNWRDDLWIGKLDLEIKHFGWH